MNQPSSSPPGTPPNFDSIPPQKIIARVAAGSALAMTAGLTSGALDAFALWFLAAFAAGLALVISQIKEVIAVIPLQTISDAAYLFLGATVLCVSQRYVAMVVGVGAKGAEEGSKLGEKFPNMDPAEFLSEMLRGFPKPVRIFCTGLFKALGRGDFAVSGRLFMRLVFIQGALVTGQVVLLLIALSKVIQALATAQTLLR